MLLDENMNIIHGRLFICIVKQMWIGRSWKTQKYIINGKSFIDSSMHFSRGSMKESKSVFQPSCANINFMGNVEVMTAIAIDSKQT